MMIIRNIKVFTMFPLPLNIYFEIAAFITSLVLWKNLNKSNLIFFLPFLFFIVLSELTGRYLSKELSQPNAWLYNFVVPIEYLFYGFLFRKYLVKKSHQNLAGFFLLAFASYALIWLLINGVYEFNSKLLMFGSFCMIILSLLMLFQLYSVPSEKQIWMMPLFWIATGLLLFNAGEFCYDLLAEYFFVNDLDPRYQLFVSINSKLILVLYTSIIIAFICQMILEKYKVE
jgi:hypothetical protein